MKRNEASLQRQRSRHRGLTLTAAVTAALLIAAPASASLGTPIETTITSTGTATTTSPIQPAVIATTTVTSVDTGAVDPVTVSVAPVTENVVNVVAPPSQRGHDEDKEKTYEARADGSSASVKVAGREIVTVGRTEAGAGEEGASGDATVLSVLGHEVIGSDSEASGESSSSSVTGYAHETCTFGVTGVINPGSICLGVLYGYSESRDDENGSSSRSHTAVASACVGGDQKDPHERCDDDAIADVGVGESDSSASHDKRSGRSKASRSSGIARACVGGRNDNGKCKVVGVNLLQKRESVSGDGKSEESSDTSVDVLGEQRAKADPPQAFPTGCSTAESDTCAAANEGSVSANDKEPSGNSSEEGTTIGTGSASASAQGGVVRVNVMGNEVLRAGSSSAETNDEGASSDATVLSVLGHEVIGAKAKSRRKGKSQSETGYGRETCEVTGGAVCVTLLYARAQSESSESSSTDEDGTQRREEKRESHSDTYGASVCVGGEQRDPNEPCDGVFGTTVGESHSDAAQRTSGESGRDADGNEYSKSEGEAKSRNENDGATVCLGGENDDGACNGVGVNVLHSENESSATSDGRSSNEGSGYVLCVETGGECGLTVDQPTSIPPGCGAGNAPACVRLNDSQSGAGAGGGGSGGTTVLGVDILSDEDGNGQVSGRAGESGSGASATGGIVLGKRVPKEDPATRPPADRPGPGPGAGPEVLAAPQPEKLPNTGAEVLSYLLAAVALIGAGAALARRRSEMLSSEA
ncbi:MAG: LPXTG cell wall anchor domain-containing protein [Actinomycetota bacterium]|nr:LPXTG cell wall anchor domain-containing protein [Actinomycetota bacterium]